MMQYTKMIKNTSIIKFIMVFILALVFNYGQVTRSETFVVDTTDGNAYTAGITLDSDGYRDKLVGIGIVTDSPDTLSLQIWDARDSVWLDVNYEGKPLEYTAADSSYIVVDPSKFVGISKFRIKNGKYKSNIEKKPTKYIVFKREY